MSEIVVTPKETLQKAVVKVGKAIGELNKVFAKLNQKISDDDFRKAYVVLERAIAASRSKAEIDRQVSQVADDEFSLDAVDLEAIMTPPPLRPIANVIPFEKIGDPRLADPAFRSRVERHEKAKALGGRLVKNAPDEPVMAPVLPPDPDEDNFIHSQMSEPDDEVDFIDG